MVYLVIGILLIGMIITYKEAREHNEKKYLTEVREGYGKLKNIKLNDIDLNLTRGYFDFIKDKLEFYIDDITWNDLNMDEIFKGINNTGTSLGDEILYKFLREQSFDLDELKRRDNLIEFFKENNDVREDLMLKLRFIGKSDSVTMYKHSIAKKLWNYNFLYLLSKLPIVFGVLIIFKPIFFLFMIGSLLVNTYIAQKSYKYNNCRLVDYEYIIKVLKFANYVYSLDISLINDSYKNIKSELKKIGKTKRQYFLKTENSIPEAIGFNEVLKLFFLSEALKIEKISSNLRNNEEALLKAYEFVGEIDSFLAIASLRESFNLISKPEFVKNKEIIIEDAYYPLIKNPVLNSLEINNSILITGSNASGKSTFLRAAGINIIFSQSFYMSFSKSYRGDFFKVYSSMALKDDLLSKESYYMVESKSLKRIMDAKSGNENIICFIDEILRGTNTIERIAASSRILKFLAKDGYKVIAATHDLELTDILKNYYLNYHFSERILEEEIVFDYKINKGRTKTRNAIKILQILGYDDDVIKEANESANDFIKSNKWEVI